MPTTSRQQLRCGDNVEWALSANLLSVRPVVKARAALLVDVLIAAQFSSLLRVAQARSGFIPPSHDMLAHTEWRRRHNCLAACRTSC